eukprot:CAMPEP_0194303002 /NCGR_PEP_ID=MMETSP0171-20130528/905_1 /TAXON_ID=218684 /ORGANISM="Corethron pennatum, Strain L29A3" /LENGTH=84 /DNA_ID=CAMNT_0039053711 /DNA_START=28 /DNA_END=279 /DNA_ORIENTATION=-
MKCSAPPRRRRSTLRTSMPFVRLSSLASLLLALSLPSGPSSLLVSAQTNNVRNGFEYAIGQDQQNWEDHEKAAVAWGGHLASVH